MLTFVEQEHSEADSKGGNKSGGGGSSTTWARLVGRPHAEAVAAISAGGAPELLVLAVAEGSMMTMDHRCGAGAFS